MPDFILTEKNYYSSKRPHLSSSKIGDYLRSPEYYFDCHVAKTIKKKITPSMKYGSLVDELVTRQKVSFSPKVLKSENESLFEAQKFFDEDILISRTDYEDAHTLAKYILSHVDFLTDDCRYQVILEGTLEDTLVCGKADIITSNALIDLKVTNPSAMRSEVSWDYHTRDYFLYEQMALYRYLLKSDIPCYWLAASQDSDGACSLKLFKADENLLAMALERVRVAIRGIQAKKFRNESISLPSI